MSAGEGKADLPVTNADFGNCEGFRMPAHDGGSRARRGPASANLQGRKPREVWRSCASDAMGILRAAVCWRGALTACLGSKRRYDEFGRRIARHNRRCAVQIDRRGGYPWRRDGEHGRCRLRAGEAELQHWNVAANLFCS
jgi:hypothetical protein